MVILGGWEDSGACDDELSGRVKAVLGGAVGGAFFCNEPNFV